MTREFLNENKHLIKEYLCNLCTCNVDIIEFLLFEDGKWKVMYTNMDVEHFNYDKIILDEHEVVKYIRKRKIERLKDDN